jgi:hypothetical protein
MKTLPIIQSLWVGERLSLMEQLSISSFLHHGHPFNLYVYGDVLGIPEGVTIKDANKIIPSDKIFKYKDHNSYAGFANLFRYKLLVEKGNYWVDTDIICLKPLQHNTEYVFAAQRQKNSPFRYKGKRGLLYMAKKVVARNWHYAKNIFPFKNIISVNSCLIKAPKNSAIMDYCYNESAKQNPADLKWGQTGPQLLTTAVKRFDMWRYVADPEVFCPIDCWKWRNFLKPSYGKCFSSTAQTFHLWNEMWRRNNIDKSANFSEKCIYEKLKKAYLGS